MRLSLRVDGRSFRFGDLNDLLAKANRERSGDRLAGLAARSAQERVAARRLLADVTLAELRAQPALPPERDEVWRVVEEGLDEELSRRAGRSPSGPSAAACGRASLDVNPRCAAGRQLQGPTRSPLPPDYFALYHSRSSPDRSAMRFISASRCAASSGPWRTVAAFCRTCSGVSMPETISETGSPST